MTIEMDGVEDEGVAVVTLRCDRPGCVVTMLAYSRPTNAACRAVAIKLVKLAEQNGWQLSPHGDVPLDFCKVHVDPERPGLAVTRLYDEHGKALPYKGQR